MPDLRFKPTAAQNTEIPRPKRAEGQWALGYTEPLNKNEQSKKDDDPLNVRDRILYTYSRRGFDSIDPADLRGRFRWLGLYTQRAPGFDGGKTAQLEEEELDDRFFMMRVRTDGQVLDAAALRALGEMSTAYGRNTADITDRNNIQYHWIEIESVPAIWERLEAVGLTTLEACGDSPRPFLGSPVAGIAKDEIIDGTEALEEIKRRVLGNPDFSNLPRKFKTALTGHPSHDVAPEVNDVSFVGTVHPEHGPGFDLWVGGGLSTNPMLAHKLGVWIPLDEVADAWEGVAGIFRDYGYRRLRSKARLKFLLADWGKEKFREVLENEYLHRALVDNPSPETPVRQGDHIGIHEQKDGRFYIGAAPTVGRIDGTTLSALGDLVEAYGARGARLTAYQKLVVIGVAAEDTAAFADDLEKIGLTAAPQQLAALDDGLHRHRVLQAAPSSTPRSGRAAWCRSSRSASPTSTPTSRSTSTAAPTHARAPRSPTSASRASSSWTTPATRSRASRCTSAAGSRSAPTSAASCAPTRSPAPASTTTSPPSSRRTSPTAPTASGSPRGSPVPTRSCCAGSRWRPDERTRAALPLPLLRGPEPVPPGGCRCLGVPRVPAQLHREDDRDDPARRRPRMSASTQAARDFKGTHTEGRTPEELRELVSHVGAELELAPAEVIIEWAVATFGDRFAITSSMGDAVLAHLASTVAPGIDVVFLDTGYHFIETIGTRDAVEATLPGQPSHGQHLAHRRRAGRAVRQGPLQDRPRPLLRAAQGEAAGRHARRVRRLGDRPAACRDPQPGDRPVVGWDARKGKVKVPPLARWSDEQVEAYIVDNGVLVNPLVHDGYPSIGCWPCTVASLPATTPQRPLGRHLEDRVRIHA